MLEQQEYIGLLIGAARRRLKQAVLTRLVPHPLTPQQFWLLLAIRDLPGASLGAVAERQRLDLPTASRVVQSLGERGLVLLERSLEDRRRASVKLTAKGEGLIKKLQPIADGVRGAVVQGLSGGEQETLRKLLRRVIVNLDAHVAGGAPLAAVKRKAVKA